ncbi:MAG TPA: DUF3788 domain-containing protein [Candidatus Paceibacterota bacterium]|nr:DUF3788 domain-containing protein [Verrucomicrobiota bacterium]HRY48125.1 DUF3788 domain-containing protein [Candidatus Paceibacterota bacterium]HSA00606.1 DUF3788 domain-containing protein [Candidatus Paceibacterota bacterium]
MTPANAFINKPYQPTEAEMATALGPAKASWDRLLTELSQEYGVDIHEWKCHSPKWGWSLRVKRKARTIVWLSPSSGCFTVLFILGGKAMQAAWQSQLPQRIVKVMEKAPKYPEGTGVRLVVKSPKDIAALLKLATIKLAN